MEDNYFPSCLLGKEYKLWCVRTLLSAGLLDLLGQANADQAVVGLELLHGLGRVVDESKASGLATTELGAQAEDRDLVLAGLVEAGELVTELLLGDVGAVGVQDVTDQGGRATVLAKRESLDTDSCSVLVASHRVSLRLPPTFFFSGFPRACLIISI